MYFIFAKVILKQAHRMFQGTLTKETLDTWEKKRKKKCKSWNNCSFRLIQVTCFLIMEITQFQIKVFVTLFFVRPETSSGSNKVEAQEDEYSSGGIKHKKDMTSHGRYSCCCLAMVINYHALGDVHFTCLITCIWDMIFCFCCLKFYIM